MEILPFDQTNSRSDPLDEIQPSRFARREERGSADRLGFSRLRHRSLRMRGIRGGPVGNYDALVGLTVTADIVIVGLSVCIPGQHNLAAIAASLAGR